MRSASLGGRPTGCRPNRCSARAHELGADPDAVRPMAGRFACPRPCAIGLPASRRIRARTWRARCWATIEGYRRHAGAGTGFMRTRTEQAIELMMRFAERTGLTAGRPHQRYLWTDAFAVCNFLGLARVTGEPRFTELALQLVDQVHHVLGRHRADDRRTGWISGLTDEQGEAHPTCGGLRIGKPLPERTPDEPARRAARVGSRRPVLPLPHEVDARARSGDARDRPDDVQPMGARARPARRTARSRTCRDTAPASGCTGS